MTFPDDWQYKVKLTSDNTKVAAAIKGLAVDLSHMPAGFWTNVKSDGSDIRITDSSNNLVARDVVSIEKITDTDIQNGLVSYWKFDEGTGTTAVDSVGSNNGTLNISSIWDLNGKINGGIDFGSTNNYVNTGIAGNSALTSSFSYNVWISMNDLSENKDIMGHRGVGIAVVLNFNSADGFRAWLYRSGDYLIYSNIMPTIGEYNMLTLTFNGSSKVGTLYVNGEPVGSVNVGGQPTLGSNPIIIGNGYRDATTGAYTYGINAKIDEPSLWNIEMTPKQIKALYNLQKGGETTGQYPFANTGLGLVRFDTSGISTSTDTDYYLYYDNDSATEPGSTGTYDSSLIAYLPFNDNVEDRMGTYTPTVGGTIVYENGIFNKAARSGTSTSNHIAISSTSYRSTYVSYSGWVKINQASFPTLNSYIVGNEKASDDTGMRWGINGSSGISLSYDRCGISGNIFVYRDAADVPMNTFIRMRVIFDTASSKLIAFYNGVRSEQAYTPGSGSCAYTEALRLFNRATSVSNNSDLTLSEFMIDNKLTTENEELTQYNNEASNNTFWTFGPQEDATGGVSLKYYNGSSFIDASVKYWNGSSWEDATAIKRYNGSTWDTI